MRSVNCFLCCVLIFMLLVATASAAADPVTADTVRVASNRDGDNIEVRPLDDPDNPYAGQYGAWDIWAWDNYTPGFKHSDYQHDYDSEPPVITGPDGELLPEGWMYTQVYVDAEGFVIPGLRISELVWGQPDGLPLDEFILSVYTGRSNRVCSTFFGSGVKPSELLEAEHDASWKQLAQQYPVIPAWLGEHLPQRLVFSPNGEFICYGELDRHYQELADNLQYPEDHFYAEETWYRYSVDGELLGTYLNEDKLQSFSWGIDWTGVYCPDINERVDEARSEISRKREDRSMRTTRLTNCGYLALVMLPETEGDSFGSDWLEGAEIARAWDMYGDEVALDTIVETGPNLGKPINREYLEPVYEAQVKLGMTDPAAVSPFAGLENGPQVVDPAPRFPRLLAFKADVWWDAREILPPDDPANPYLGEYREWDDWLLGQFGERNPREMEHNERMFKEMQEAVEAKQAAGEEVTQADYRHVPYAKPEDDPWEEYEIPVDDDGWIIPAHLYPAIEAEYYTEPWDARQRGRRPEPGGYSLKVGGVMPEEMLAGYEAACKAPIESGFPVVPAWLAGVPVLMVVFVPNGDIVTLGPLGYRNAENYVLAFQPQAWGEDERAWYRYDAAGNLLDSYATKGDDWQALYYPQWNTLKTNALDTGLEARDSYGYLVISDPATGECKAVFDYDGMPVDPNSPVDRPWGYCTALYWGKVLEFPVEGGGELTVPEDQGEDASLHEVATQTESVTTGTGR